MKEHKCEQGSLVLCSGLQSGGTSLISWCFLQREDMDGILDLPPDILKPLPKISTRRAWIKSTISSFRWEDVAEYYRQYEWEVSPLLVIRDPRRSYASLRRKFYGPNGTTAEDPPLRLRMHRYLRDWELFSKKGWPVIKYEAMLIHPEEVLKKACNDLRLPWDDNMISWPKSLSQISDADGGNETFLRSLYRGNLYDALIPSESLDAPVDLPRSELDWMENMFFEFNTENAYPTNLPTKCSETNMDLPSFLVTRRHNWEKVWEKVLNDNLEYIAKLEETIRRLKRNYVIGGLIRMWGLFVNKSYRKF